MNYLNQLKQLDKDQEAEGIMNFRLKGEIANIEIFKSIGETLKKMKLKEMK